MDHQSVGRSKLLAVLVHPTEKRIPSKIRHELTPHSFCCCCFLCALRRQGVGKTYSVREVCRDLCVRLFVLDGAALFGGSSGAGTVAGQAEQTMRDKFAEARDWGKAAVLFIDEIVSIEAQRCCSSHALRSTVLKLALTLVFRFCASSFYQDVLCPERSSGSQLSSRLVAQLLSLMDGIENRGHLLVVGATNQ